MAQIGDILEKERKRETDCDGRVIHLFQEGSFYRAYERSAWLCVKHVSLSASSLSNYAHNPYTLCDLWAVDRQSGLYTHEKPICSVSWLSVAFFCSRQVLPSQICFSVS